MSITRPIQLCAFLLVAAPSCVIEPIDDIDEVDDAIDEDAFDGKEDTVQALKHYVLTKSDSGSGFATLSRAGGGKLRCPSDSVEDTCEEVNSGDLELPSRLGNVDVVIDELEDYPMMLRGRIVRESGGRVYVRVSAITRAISSVIPDALCYRLRPLTTAGNCPVGSEPFCYENELEKLDSTHTELVHHIVLDGADPTPDFWSQATPAIQAKIDAGLLLARSRPVYTCGDIEDRNGNVWFFGNQLFVPKG